MGNGTPVVLVHGNEGVILLIDDLSISDAVLCGYDVGSFTEQTIAVKRHIRKHVREAAK